MMYMENHKDLDTTVGIQGNVEGKAREEASTLCSRKCLIGRNGKKESRKI